MFDKVVIVCPVCGEEEERVVAGIEGSGGVYHLDELYPDDALYGQLKDSQMACVSCEVALVITTEEEGGRLVITPDG